MPESKDWTLLAIGGASQTGKSTLGRALARRFDAGHVDTDLFWITLQRAMPDEALLHAFDDDVDWTRPTEALVEDYLRVSRFVCNALENVMAHLDKTAQRSVIEGSWLLPEYVARREFAGWRMRGEIRSLFIHEAQPEMSQYVLSPNESFGAKSRQVQEAQLRMHQAHGVEINRRAEALELPVVASRPLETLEARAIRALGLG